MHRLRALALATGFSLAIAIVALFYVWGAFALALAATQWFAGWMGETIAAFIAAGLLVVGCLLAAQAAVWARARWDAHAGAARHPRRRAFAARALEGEFLSDAQIDFLLDPSRRVTCAHLQPVEQALRAAGAPMTVGEPGFLWTEWSLDGPRLLREMPLPGVHWQVPAAHPRDPQPGYLRCPACGSRIEGGFGASFPRA